MPVSLPTDDQLDPLEQADLDEEMADEHDEDAAASVSDDVAQPTDDTGAATTAVDLDPEIVEEIKRVMVDEDLVVEQSTVKPKTHMVPQRLIDQPLNPETDLWNEGDGTI